MREQSSEEADEWNYESEWESEEVCELMSEDLNQYVSEKVNDFDVWAPKMTTSSMLGRHWTECLLHSLTD